MFFPHLLVKVAAARQGGAVDEEDGVHFYRVQQIRSLQRESGSQVSSISWMFVNLMIWTFDFLQLTFDSDWLSLILNFPRPVPLLRIGVSVKQQFTEEEIYKDRDSQISAIEKTFEDAQKPVG